MTRVKICGLRRAEDATVAAEAGASFIGLVFAPSKRRVDTETARQVADATHASGARTVGVFVNEDAAVMNRLARECGLDYVQFSGDEPDDLIAALDVPVIRTVHVLAGLSQEVLAARITASPAALVLLDTARAGTYGGTGETFDWSGVQSLQRPVLLAGGLRPDNVGEAIRVVQPWGVDVSSGVERDGVKDPDLIRAFLKAIPRP